MAAADHLLQAGHLDAAMEPLRRVVELSPDLAEPWFILGYLHSRRQDFGAARQCLMEAVRREPGHVLAWFKLGRAEQALGRLNAAERAYRKSSALSPQTPELRATLGSILLMMGHADAAIGEYRQALGLAPHDALIQANLLLATNASETLSPEEVFEEHRRWGASVEQDAGPVVPHQNNRDPNRRLRIGYVSLDFREHAVWKWLEPILAHHDRERFEVYCYSAHPHTDSITQRAREYATLWREIAALTDQQAAGAIRADQIDILVDLSGHTVANRLGIFARKPAPVQMSYLGYPNTTGLYRIDYLITDAHIDPPGQTEQFHSERLLRVARCFSVFGAPKDAPEVAPLPAKANGYVTFGSFNTFGKLSPATVALWSSALGAVPSSRLVLKSSDASDEEFHAEIRDRFAAHEIEPGRIEILPPSPGQREHLAAYDRIDIALDSFPYQGTTTTCDALWMGVPVISRVGPTHPSRVAVSLLKNLSLDDLLAANTGDFAKIAAALAADLDGLSALRNDLRPRMGASRLTDARSFIHDYEHALRGAWQTYCAEAR